VVDPLVVKAASRLSQIEMDLSKTVLIRTRFGQCRPCGGMFVFVAGLRACTHCGSENFTVDEELPVGCADDDYDDDGNLRDDVCRKGRPSYRPVDNSELDEALESEFGRPGLYDDVCEYYSHHSEPEHVERRWRHQARALVPPRRCRARARRSHRVVRAVAKTAGGDSGDGDGEPAEPDGSRRALTIGGAP
jgi:hypothetical protein